MNQAHSIIRRFTLLTAPVMKKIILCIVLFHSPLLLAQQIDQPQPQPVESAAEQAPEPAVNDNPEQLEALMGPVESSPLASESDPESELPEAEIDAVGLHSEGRATSSSDPLAGPSMDRFEGRAIFQGHMEARQYAEAVTVAEQVLVLSERDLGMVSLELVPVLDELGTALVLAGRPEESIQHFERSVDLLRDLDGIFSVDLVSPYSGMGMAMQRLGNHEGAVGFFQRAQHITHRHNGVSNMEQLSLMDSISRSMMSQNKFAEARRLQKAILKVNTLHYGAESLELAEPMIDYAKWHRRYGDFRHSRFLYHKSIDLRLAELPQEDQDMLDPLKELALSYFDRLGPFWVRGRQISDDIIDTLTLHKDSATTDEKLRAYVRAGDMLISFDDPNQAASCYLKAWRMSQSPVAESEDWPAFFNQPQILNEGPPIEPRFIKYDASKGDAYSELTFSVGTDGRPREILVTDSNLTRKNWKFAQQNFRMARFRPRIADGSIQSVKNIRYRKAYTGPKQKTLRPGQSNWYIVDSAEQTAEASNTEPDQDPPDKTVTN